MELVDWTVYKSDNGVYCLRGFIYNDENNRFSDGKLIQTSKLKSIDFEKKIASTKNSTYKLVDG